MVGVFRDTLGQCQIAPYSKMFPTTITGLTATSTVAGQIVLTWSGGLGSNVIYSYVLSNNTNPISTIGTLTGNGVGTPYSITLTLTSTAQVATTVTLTATVLGGSTSAVSGSVVTTLALVLFPTTNLLYNFSALSGTSTTTNGATIATWTDARTGLVGSNYGSSGNCIYHTDVTINSKPTITGAVSTIFGNSSTPQNSWTWYCVLRTFGGTFAGDSFFTYPANDLGNGLQIDMYIANLLLIMTGVAVAASPSSTSGGTPSTWYSSINTNYIFTMLCSGSNTTTSSTQTYTYRINGVDYTPANPTDTSKVFYIANQIVGDKRGSNQYYMGEQTLYNTVHSLATAQKMEQYLSNKWQIPIGSTPAIAS